MKFQWLHMHAESKVDRSWMALHLLYKPGAGSTKILGCGPFMGSPSYLKQKIDLCQLVFQT